MDFGKLFFSAYGRIGRQEFWLAWVILFAVGLFTCFIPLINVIAWAGIFYCTVCIRSKRLHDMGRTGWWQLIPHVARFIGFIIMVYFIIAMIIAGVTWNMMFEPAAIAGVVAGAMTLVLAMLATCFVNLGFLIWIGASERDPYDNQYGPAPEPSSYSGAVPA